MSSNGHATAVTRRGDVLNTPIAATAHPEGVPRSVEEQRAWSEYLEATRTWRTQDYPNEPRAGVRASHARDEVAP